MRRSETTAQSYINNREDSERARPAGAADREARGFKCEAEATTTVAEHVRIFAGDCTTVFEGTREQTQRGTVVVVKPDRTVLVHDADGYQPVAWLTRPDELTVEEDEGSVGLTARTDDQTLRVVSNDIAGRATYPVDRAGVPVGTDPETGAPLVRAGGAVRNLETGREYAVPAGATVRDEPCPSCGLPTARVERGAVFDVCLDPACDPLIERVRERFDREWTCPDCDSPLRIFRSDGGPILAGCTAYPECETAFSVPSGVVGGECPCGLPLFETERGERCLDGSCDERT
jgi:DNA topoisomerase-1